MTNSLTLRDAYERHHKSRAHKARTDEKFRNLLSWWARLTGNPPVEEITNRTLLEFREGLLEHLKPTTVNSLLGHLMAILSAIGPTYPGHPYGLGLIDRIPHVKKVKTKARKPRIVPQEALVAIYRACEGATWPHVGIHQPDWWRALIVFLYNVGVRRNDFRSLRMTDISLTRGFLTLLAEKDDQEDRIVPLHQCVIDHLETVWQPPRGLVFPMSRRHMDVAAGRTPKQLYQHWYGIQAAAGVPKPFYVFHEMRKTCGTQLFERSPAAAQAMLGHSSVETTRQFYASVDRALVQTAMATEQPWEGPGEPKPVGRRLRLFGA